MDKLDVRRHIASKALVFLEMLLVYTMFPTETIEHKNYCVMFRREFVSPPLPYKEVF